MRQACRIVRDKPATTSPAAPDTPLHLKPAVRFNYLPSPGESDCSDPID